MQTRMGEVIADRLTAKWGLDVDVSRLKIDFPNQAVLEGLVVYDLNRDTLISVAQLSVQSKELIPSLSAYRFKSIRLEGAFVHIHTIDSLGTTNISFLTNGEGIPQEQLDAAQDSIQSFLLNQYTFSVDNLEMVDCHFKYSDLNIPEKETGVDFYHIDIAQIDSRISDFTISGDSLYCQIMALSMKEKSGFELTNFRSKTKINETGIYADELQFTTTKSLVIGSVSLGHVAWEDYRHFVDEIDWSINIDESNLNLSDIGYFTEDLANRDVNLLFRGNLRGVLEDLKGRKVSITTEDNSTISGSFDISGMTDMETAFMDLRIKSWETTYAEIEKLSQSIFDRTLVNVGISDELERAGHLSFKGGFTGFTKDFVANGVLRTDVGSIDMDINLEADSINDRLIYRGSILTDALNIGALMEIEKLGLVTAQADIVAHSREELEELTIDGVINSLEYADYEYKNLTVDGTISKNKFKGQLFSRDPNVNFDFIGTVDFSHEVPLLDFYADVFNMDLSALNLIDSEVPLSFSSRMQLRARGLELNNTQGGLEATDSYVCYGDSVIILKNLKLTAAGDTSNRKIALTSDVADFNITGAFNAEYLPGKMNRVVSLVFPSLVDTIQETRGEDFQFSINYKQSNIFSGLFFDGLYIAPNTSAYGSFNSDKAQLRVFFRSDSLAYMGSSLEKVSLDLNLVSNTVDGHIYVNSSEVNGILAENVNFDIGGVADSILVSASCLNTDNSLRVNIGALLNVSGKQKLHINLQPSFVGNKTALWQLTKESVVEVDSTMIFVDAMTLENGSQRLEIQGFISEDPEDELVVQLNDFDFATLDSSLILNQPIQGILNVSGTVKDFYNDRLIYAQAEIAGLQLGEYIFGNVIASSRYYGDDKRMALRGGLTHDTTQVLMFEGSYTIGNKRPLEGLLKLKGVDLDLLNAFRIPEVSDYSGNANGEIYVKGQFTEPELEGFIDFENARFKIEYLNTHFIYDDRVRVEDGWFGIDYKPLYDARNKKGYLVASAFHENFRNWSYDVDVETDNFFLLNTTRDMNDTYYGTAYGSGDIQLGGYDDFLEINIDATTEKGTSIKLPLDESDDVTMENFVYFVNPNSEEVKERNIDLQGVQMRLNVDVTPEAEIQLIFDEKAGDIIRGKGNGKITLEISPSGEFLMFGRYEIEEGSYLFTLKNLINKQFELRRGGTIGWYGDPYQADIDISASYLVRSSLYPIMVENQDKYRGRENVNVVLNLKDKLLNPSLSFDIELPQATETERAQLASVVSTTQQLNQQVFSLLILNRFLPVTPSQEEQAVTVTGVGGFGSTTTSDFVSTQISNWLSEISNDFDIGVNYRPGDQISNQEIAVALSTQLFNERLHVSGNFGVTTATELQYTQGQSGILGDFMLEYSITEEGKIRLKVFNETNPYEVFSTSSSIYTQGVGLIYQEDFDTVDEFFLEIKSLFTKDEAKKAESETNP